MKKFYLFLATIMAGMAMNASAQVVTTSPTPLQESSQNVVLTYHPDAEESNKTLANLPESKFLYAHIGVITNKSTGTGDWKYVVTEWPTNDGSNAQTVNLDKNHLVYQSPNTYTLEIGNIREYFGISDPDELVRYIAMVPRTADGKMEGKLSSGSDILVDVLSEGFDITFSSNADKLSPVFNRATTLRFTLQSTKAADLEITVNGTAIASEKGSNELTASFKMEE
ncbi:MAG: hypothetical protein K2I56_04435, partial [Muribaculaceae bacterium]|nr:hypothetical protein [Muribaculaceae bacterium]